MAPLPLASRLDAQIARPDALAADVHKLAADAIRLGVGAVVTAPVWTLRLATMLRGSGVRVGSLVAYPHGSSKPTVKAIEATSTIKDGADRIEIVPHLPHVLSLDLDGARAELLEVVRAARMTRRDVQVAAVVDVGLLMHRSGERAVEAACRGARESGCDGLVIAADATADLLALVKKYAEALTIKVSPVNDPASARAALQAGANFVGTEDPAAVLRDDAL